MASENSSEPLKVLPIRLDPSLIEELERINRENPYTEGKSSVAREILRKVFAKQPTEKAGTVDSSSKESASNGNIV